MKSYPYQFIGGQWRPGRGSSTMENRNPFTGELLYTYQSASVEDVDDAYKAAAAAQPGWAALLPGEKQSYFFKLLDVIAEMKDEIMSVLVEEGGSVAAKKEFEFFTCLDIVKEDMQFPYMMDGRIMPSNVPGKDNYVVKQPRGVIGVIAPWNVPLVLAMRSVVPAIATGNAVVLKPATDTPASACLVGEMFERAGFPAGLVNVVMGRGSEIGDAIVTNPIPELISFTGSTPIGRHIGEVATGLLKEVSLELGGNNPMIVLDDADPEAAARAAVFGAFFNQGQVCMCLNRIIVTPGIHDAFLKAFVEATAATPVGDPADPSTFIGPIISQAQVKSVEGFIDDTVKAGAKVVLQGSTDGNLIHPWIFDQVTNDMPAAANEVFGPVCCIITAKDEEDAIALANDTEHGLSGSVFTEDLYHGFQVAKRMRTGMVHVNDQSIGDEPHVMFGGEKASGVGRFNAQWVVDRFTTDRWISIQREKRF